MAEAYQPLFNRTYLKVILWVVAITIVLLNWHERQRVAALIPWQWQQGSTEVRALNHDNKGSEVWILSFAPGAMAEAQAGTAALADTMLQERLPGGASHWFLDRQMAFSTQLTQEHWQIQLQLPDDEDHRQQAIAGLQQLFSPTADDQQHTGQARLRLLAQANLLASRGEALATQGSLLALYPDHPVSRPLYGSRASLATVNASTVDHFVSQFWQTAPQQLLLLGDLDESQAKQLAQQLLAKLPQQAMVAQAAPALPSARAEPLALQRPQLRQQAAMALTLPEADPYQRTLLLLWLTQLGQQHQLQVNPWRSSEQPVVLFSWEGDLQATPPQWQPLLQQQPDSQQLDALFRQVATERKNLEQDPLTLAQWLTLAWHRGQPLNVLKVWDQQQADEPRQAFLQLLTQLARQPRGEATVHP